jgi:hypothetical protein
MLYGINDVHCSSGEDLLAIFLSLRLFSLLGRRRVKRYRVLTLHKVLPTDKPRNCSTKHSPAVLILLTSTVLGFC